MKILYLTDQYKPEYYTGTIKVLENISRYFSNNNEVKILTYSENFSEIYDKCNAIKYWHENIDNIDCIKFYIKKDSSINYGLYNEDVYNFAVKMIKEINPDIIHIIHPRRVASFMKAAIDLNKKYIITCTDTFLMCANLFLLNKSYSLCEQRHIEGICSKECYFDDRIIRQNKVIAKEYVDNAYALVVDSQFQIKIFSEYFDREVIVINHGNRVYEKNSVKKNYPKEKLIFSFNGNSSALKGLVVAIGAFNILEKSKDVNVELHVYGSCDDTVKLIAGENVKFFGIYDNKNISKILGTVDMLICPSICYENYPFVITEAFMNRVPVLASNEGGMKAIVKDFINGFTFTRANPKHLSEVIKSIYFNQSLISQMVNNLNDFKAKTIEEEMEEYTEIYEKCINGEILNNNLQSDIEIMWKNIMESKYNFENIVKYSVVIEEVAKRNNYHINIEEKYRFIIRLKNMEENMKSKDNKLISIWGTGTSALLTIQIIRRLYSDIGIEFVVDRFKLSGEFQGVVIKDINTLKSCDFDYLFICTSPGKKNAEEMMGKLNKEININYNFGICVE